mgnify:FL=1|jgi:hypothetical protein
MITRRTTKSWKGLRTRSKGWVRSRNPPSFYRTAMGSAASENPVAMGEAHDFPDNPSLSLPLSQRPPRLRTTIRDLLHPLRIAPVVQVTDTHKHKQQQQGREGATPPQRISRPLRRSSTNAALPPPTSLLRRPNLAAEVVVVLLSVRTPSDLRYAPARVRQRSPLDTVYTSMTPQQQQAQAAAAAAGARSLSRIRPNRSTKSQLERWPRSCRAIRPRWSNRRRRSRRREGRHSKRSLPSCRVGKPRRTGC